jgi:hypothetical protein
MVDAEPGEHAAVAQRSERQLRLIMVGAANWRAGYLGRDRQ